MRDIEHEAGMALALAESLRTVVEDMKAKLPPGTHFALVIDIPGTETEPDGRIAADALNAIEADQRSSQPLKSVRRGRVGIVEFLRVYRLGGTR